MKNLLERLARCQMHAVKTQKNEWAAADSSLRRTTFSRDPTRSRHSSRVMPAVLRLLCAVHVPRRLRPGPGRCSARQAHSQSAKEAGSRPQSWTFSMDFLLCYNPLLL